MKNVTLWDFHNLSARCYFALDATNPDIPLWRFNVIDNIYQALYKTNTDEVVLAVDDNKSWRKLYWPRYKENRKKQRDKSGIDWDFYHSKLQELVHDIQESLPFKVIQVKHCEGDDIIAVISKDIPNKYIIMSVDEDFKQLCSENILLYNTHHKKKCYVTCENPEEFVIKKCLTGQAKDGIFNIKTPLDWPEDKRKPGFGEVAATKVMNEGYEKWLKDNGLEERFDINRILMDFNRIPKTIRTSILNTYNSYKLPDPDQIYPFFTKNKFNTYLDDMGNVENKLLTLY